jgi:hypothetical protein
MSAESKNKIPFSLIFNHQECELNEEQILLSFLVCFFTEILVDKKRQRPQQSEILYFIVLHCFLFNIFITHQARNSFFFFFENK